MVNAHDHVHTLLTVPSVDLQVLHSLLHVVTALAVAAQTVS